MICGITLNVDVNFKKIHVCEKDYVWNAATCRYENGKCLASTNDKIICDEIIDVKETTFKEKI